MTRHGRNCTAGAVYSYHERKRDAQVCGYGSKELRFSKDSLKGFDCCSLTLQPCRNPMVTSDGHVFDKEVILEYIIKQKKIIANQLKAYEKQKEKKDREHLSVSAIERKDIEKNFLETESNIVSKHTFIQSDTKESLQQASISNMKSGKEKELPSFWVPNQTPAASKTEVKKPDEKVRCPVSGQTLRMKDLTDIIFTPIKDGDDKKSVIVKDARYVCAVTNDVLSDSVPCMVLKTSSNVITVECYEKIIKKDMIDPTNGKKIREKDVIYLQRGSSAFSSSGMNLVGKIAGAVLQA